LVHRECHRRGIATGTAATGRTRLDLGFALAAGGVAAAVLVRTAGASVLADQLAETELVCDVDVRAYYDRNLDEFSDGARSFAEARSDIRTELRAAARRRAFTRWLDQAQREVTLLPGYEHPAEPGHADATHRH
jgi:[acyl-carrier-protein] S-malonyltransferase